MVNMGPLKESVAKHTKPHMNGLETVKCVQSVGLSQQRAAGSAAPFRIINVCKTSGDFYRLYFGSSIARFSRTSLVEDSTWLYYTAGHIPLSP